MITDLFSIPIFKKKYEGDLEIIKSSVIPKIDKLVDEYDCTNFPNMINGALCSYAKPFNIESWTELNPVISLVTTCIKEYTHTLKVNKNLSLVQDSSWISLYPPNAYLDLHAHDKVGIATVFYLQKPLNSGNLILKNNFNIWSHYKQHNDIEVVNNEELVFEVEEGDIVMFPGFLLHGTQPNLSNDNRIIIGCDFKFTRK